MLILSVCIIIAIACIWVAVSIRTLKDELEALKAVLAFQANIIKDVAIQKGCLSDHDIYKIIVDKRGKVKYYDGD